MASLREYFDTDLKSLSVHHDWEAKDASGKLFATIRARISQDFDANAKYWSFFIPSGCDYRVIALSIFSNDRTSRCFLTDEGDTVLIEMGFAGYSEKASSKTLAFTRRVFLYIDALLSQDERKQISDVGNSLGYHVLLRDREYAIKRSEIEKPLAFISHDTGDKDSFVRDLAIALTKLMCPVWYDEFSLQVGDSLREKIEAGLKEAPKCVLVLSPNFFANKGWGLAEYDSIFTREIVEKKKLILPVWHNVDVKGVFEFSPRLADRVGLKSSLGTDEVARRLAAAIKQAPAQEITNP